ncbi:MAG: response regulator [Ferruginibacter sp.]
MQTPYILLVDDDPDDLMLLREAIESLGENFLVFECKDGRSALNFLKQKQLDNSLPGLIVLDINMPVLDGREVLAILKSDPGLKKIPAVVFTTSSNPADINYCAQFNVALFTKPFNISMLEEMAKKIVSYYEV